MLLFSLSLAEFKRFALGEGRIVHVDQQQNGVTSDQQQAAQSENGERQPRAEKTKGDSARSDGKKFKIKFLDLPDAWKKSIDQPVGGGDELKSEVQGFDSVSGYLSEQMQVMERLYRLIVWRQRYPTAENASHAEALLMSGPLKDEVNFEALRRIADEQDRAADHGFEKLLLSHISTLRSAVEETLDTERRRIVDEQIKPKVETIVTSKTVSDTEKQHLREVLTKKLRDELNQAHLDCLMQIHQSQESLKKTLFLSPEEQKKDDEHEEIRMLMKKGDRRNREEELRLEELLQHQMDFHERQELIHLLNRQNEADTGTGAVLTPVERKRLTELQDMYEETSKGVMKRELANAKSSLLSAGSFADSMEQKVSTIESELKEVADNLSDTPLSKEEIQSQFAKIDLIPNQEVYNSIKADIDRYDELSQEEKNILKRQVEKCLADVAELKRNNTPEALEKMKKQQEEIEQSVADAITEKDLKLEPKNLKSGIYDIQALLGFSVPENVDAPDGPKKENPDGVIHKILQYQNLFASPKDGKKEEMGPHEWIRDVKEKVLPLLDQNLQKIRVAEESMLKFSELTKDSEGEEGGEVSGEKKKVLDWNKIFAVAKDKNHPLHHDVNTLLEEFALIQKATEKTLEDVVAVKANVNGAIDGDNIKRQGEFSLKTSIQWYSIYDVLQMFKAVPEYFKRNYETKSKVRSNYLGSLVAMGGLKNEFESGMKGASKKAISEWEDRYKNLTSPRLLAVVRENPDPNRVRAAINLLVEKGQMRWNDPLFLRNLSGILGNTLSVKESEEMAKDNARAKAWVKQAVIKIWYEESVFSNWDSNLAGGYEKKMKSYDSQVKEYYAGKIADKQLEGILKEYIKKNRNSVEDGVNPHKYEQVVYHALDDGLSTVEQKLYFYAKGFESGLIPVWSPSFKALVGKMPYLEYFAGTDTERLDKAKKMIAFCEQDREKDPNTGMPMTDEEYVKKGDKFFTDTVKWRVHLFMQTVMIHDGGVDDRFKKTLTNGGTKVGGSHDHDDLQAFIYHANPLSMQQLIKVEGGSKEKHTEPGWKNSIAGFLDGVSLVAHQIDPESGKPLKDLEKYQEKAKDMIGSYMVLGSVLADRNTDPGYIHPWDREWEDTAPMGHSGVKVKEIDIFMQKLAEETMDPVAKKKYFEKDSNKGRPQFSLKGFIEDWKKVPIGEVMKALEKFQNDPLMRSYAAPKKK